MIPKLFFYSSVRKSYKWSTKIFFHFFEEAVFNSFTIYSKCGGTKRFLQYKIELIEQTLQFTGTTRMFDCSSDRLRGRHFPSLMPRTEKTQNPMENVQFVSNCIRRDVRYYSERCFKKPSLCAAPCLMTPFLNQVLIIYVYNITLFHTIVIVFWQNLYMNATYKSFFRILVTAAWIYIVNQGYCGENIRMYIYASLRIYTCRGYWAKNISFPGNYTFKTLCWTDNNCRLKLLIVPIPGSIVANYGIVPRCTALYCARCKWLPGIQIYLIKHLSWLYLPWT